MIEPFLLAEAGDGAPANRASEAWIIAFAFPRESSSGSEEANFSRDVTVANFCMIIGLNLQ